jgi:hypothetical protein
MFIELVDALRCVVPHEESWLVASSTRMEARHIVDGALGCHVCLAEYPIHAGVVDMRRPGGTAVPRAPLSLAACAVGADRLAAFLDLTDARGFALLVGGWCTAAPVLRTLVETPLILIDPPAGVIGEPGISVLRCDAVLPLAEGAARAVAMDAGGAPRIASVVRATRAKGRIIAPVEIPTMEGVRELARDEAIWIGEREALPSPLVTLHVRRG